MSRSRLAAHRQKHRTLHEALVTGKTKPRPLTLPTEAELSKIATEAAFKDYLTQPNSMQVEFLRNNNPATAQLKHDFYQLAKKEYAKHESQLIDLQLSKHNPSEAMLYVYKYDLDAIAKKLDQDIPQSMENATNSAKVVHLLERNIPKNENLIDSVLNGSLSSILYHPHVNTVDDIEKPHVKVAVQSISCDSLNNTISELMSGFQSWSQDAASQLMSDQPVAQRNSICGCGGIGRTAFC